MRVFKTRHFARWAKKSDIIDEQLSCAVEEIKAGLVEANLGGHLFKKRVAVGSQGKRAGARTILAYQKGHRVLFIFGYAKNAKANISEDEKLIARNLAQEFFSYTDGDIATLIRAGKLSEVEHE